MTQETRRRAVRELDRFFALAVKAKERGGETLNMPICIVDSAWHDLLEQPAKYKALTQAHSAYGIDHCENKGVGVIDWVPEYESHYGQLDPIWFMAPSGEIDRKSLDEYRSTGTWRASWDCTPYVHVPN